MFKKGFTLIELLVVISIISLLSSIIFAGINTAREKARDGRRKADLAQIRNAILLYYDKRGNYIEGGSGCGSSGNGSGYFNYVGGVYTKSIAQCLIDEGIVPQEIIDPTGGRSTGRFYMKYSCSSGTFLYANLETGPQGGSTATDATCCTTCDSSYGMNYVVKVQ